VEEFWKKKPYQQFINIVPFLYYNPKCCICTETTVIRVLAKPKEIANQKRLQVFKQFNHTHTTFSLVLVTFKRPKIISDRNKLIKYMYLQWKSPIVWDNIMEKLFIGFSKYIGTWHDNEFITIYNLFKFQSLFGTIQH